MTIPSDLEDITQPLEVIAQLFHLVPRTIEKLAHDGIIPKRVIRKGFPLARCVQGYVKYLQENGGSARNKQNNADFNSEKTRLTKAQADLAELALEKARGEVVPLADIEKNVGNLFAEVRVNIRNLPERISPTIVGMTDERELKRLLLEEIDLILTTLADTAVVIEGIDNKDDDDMYTSIEDDM